MMKKFKIEVTVQGSGADNPGGGSITKTPDIWTCKLRYPNSQGKLFEHYPSRDVFRVYVGIDSIPDKPTFTGFLTQEVGENVKELNLFGRQYAAQKDDEGSFLTQYNHLDGREISNAISTLLSGLDVSFNEMFQGTNPASYVTPDFRFESGSLIYPLIKQLRNSVVDNSDPLIVPLRYIMYEDDNDLHFRKEPRLDESPWWTLTGGDNLLNSAPRTKVFGTINKQTVVGKDGVKSTYKDFQRIQEDGTFAGKPIKNETLLSVAECYEEARRIVELSKFKVVNTNVNALELIDAIPRLSLVEVINSKNVETGIHRVENVVIDFSAGLKVNADIERSIPKFGQQVSQSIPANVPGPIVLTPSQIA